MGTVCDILTALTEIAVLAGALAALFLAAGLF